MDVQNGNVLDYAIYCVLVQYPYTFFTELTLFCSSCNTPAYDYLNKNVFSLQPVSIIDTDFGYAINVRTQDYSEHRNQFGLHKYRSTIFSRRLFDILK